MALEHTLRARLEKLAEEDLLRTRERSDTSEGLDASSNDYLGFAAEVVSRETLASLQGARPGAGASRLIHGTWPPHDAIEDAVATWVGTETALLFSSGFAANVGLLPALVQSGDLCISDSLNHASLIDGCRLAAGRTVVVPHLDLDAVANALAEPCDGQRWVVTETYFSMDGDSPDLTALRRLCDRHGAALVVDEAHALGVFGPAGAGHCAEAGIRADVLLGTLGKAVGAQGAFVAGAHVVCDWLYNRCRSFVFSTGVSPLLASLALFHVKRARDADQQRKNLFARAATLRQLLAERGVEVARSTGPIIPIPIGSAHRCLAVATELERRGIRARAIRPPTVPTGTARIRITVKATWSETDVTTVADALVAALEEPSR